MEEIYETSSSDCCEVGSQTSITGALCPEHREEFAGIEAGVTAERGCYSEDNADALLSLGYTPSQLQDRDLPVLVVPSFNVYGEVQARILQSTRSRTFPGLSVEYELPSYDEMYLDWHPRSRSLPNGYGVPWLITDGIKEGDLLTSRGFKCATLLGVENWADKSGWPYSRLYYPWQMLMLSHRDIYIAFGHRKETDKQVWKGFRRLISFLKTQRCKVYVMELGHFASRDRLGLEEYLAAGVPVEALMARARATSAQTRK